MNSRQFRKQRRAAARQESILEPANASSPALSSNLPSINPELLDEFTPEFMAEANRLRAAVHARAGLASDSPRRSTGPTTDHGKQIASRNSLKHGLASGELIIPGEQRAGFEALLADLRAEHQPSSATEELLVLQMAQSFWLSQRALRLQASCCSDTGLVDMHHLALLLRYQTTYDRSFHKALTTLTRLKKESLSHPSQSVSQNGQSVSQKRELVPPPAGFVSQNGQSVSQKRELVPPPAGFVSQNAGFVSQNAASPVAAISHSPAYNPPPLGQRLKEVAA